MMTPDTTGNTSVASTDPLARPERKNTITATEVMVIMPSTPSVPTWEIQVNMFRIGSSPSPAKMASTITAPMLCATEPMCGLWWSPWVRPNAAGNSPSRPAT